MLRRAMTSVARHFAYLVSLALAALALSACSADEIDSGKVEGEVADGIEKQANVQQVEVDCPEGVEIKQGDTFDCKVTGDAPGTANVTQINDDGRVRWDFTPAVGEGTPLDGDKIEREIEAEIQRRGRNVERVTAECPDDIKAKQGETFECQVSGDVTGTSTVEQQDDKGNVEFGFTPEQ